MTDTMTSQPPADVQENDGHGKHRGQLSGQDSETAPSGRHRRPESAESAAA